MDAFAVSLCANAAGRVCGHRATFRLAFHFGLFQFLMPVFGWFIGASFAGRVEAVDHWIAFGLLAWIGIRMIRAGLDPDGRDDAGDPSRGWTLILLSVATSIDALAVGFSLAMLNVRIWQPSIVIGVVAAVFSVIGYRLGGYVGARVGYRAEVLGGLVLLGIGTKILVDHLFA